MEFEQCPVSHPLLDNGAQCRWGVGHQKDGIPHTTPNGVWWFDGEEEED